MHVIRVRNVNQALPAGIELLHQVAVPRDSRNGEVAVSPDPVTTVYERPEERVVFWACRDANPFFHLMESLWMLAGRNDLAFLTKYVKRMAQFSDDQGKTQPGAYGHRWRKHFLKDQLSWAVQRLKKDPLDRRVIIQMYDANVDQKAADANGRDIPCNIVAHPQILPDGRLGLTVFCRSNDMIWGAYGANAVHFSMMQEYLARAIGVEVGPYWQVSDNYHAYLTTLEPLFELGIDVLDKDPYALGEVTPYPIMSVDAQTWDQDLALFLDHGAMPGLRDRFFRRVVVPMEMAHKAYRQHKGEEKFTIPLEILEQCAATDWRRAGTEWILRRQESYRKAADDGVTPGQNSTE